MTDSIDWINKMNKLDVSDLTDGGSSPRSAVNSFSVRFGFVI
jgi:hypothetical protein